MTITDQEILTEAKKSRSAISLWCQSVHETVSGWFSVFRVDPDKESDRLLGLAKK